MSGGKLNFSRPLSPSNRPSKQKGASSLRSPSPYHYLGLLDTSRVDNEEPLITFDNIGSNTSPSTTITDSSPQRCLLDDWDDVPQREESPSGPSEGFAPVPSNKTLYIPANTPVCIECDAYRVDLFYCNLCNATYCAKCWDKVGTHRKGKLGPGGIPHEKTDQVIADKLRATFEASPDDKEQQALFQEDENTAWFGVVKDESGDLIFHDYGRYADIMAEISKERGPSNNNRFPGLVCFVGETGAGKSSLIKVLIELSEKDGDKHQTPIVGSVRHQDVPTSGDVHLYTDPNTYLSDCPILYADCEGLAGGEREPKGAKSKLIKHMKGEFDKARRTRSFERNRRNLHHSSEREITWATTSEKQTREFAVTQLYPRLLYTFSDVVVFALKNPRVIENVIEKLVEWAAAALEMSSNQPVLPHAVIALNASELTIVPEQWEVSHATTWLMGAVKESISKNVKFRKHAQIWRARGKRINTVEDLLLSYYSSVRVVRIPCVGRPTLMKNQMEKLYGEIVASLEISKHSKRSLRMLLDVDELQPYLQFAFDHFARNLDRAFDFVQASFVSNPIPPDFAGNILKLAVNMMEIWENKLDGVGIFRELSLVVASCIMLDCSRKKNLGTVDQIYPEYVEHCDNALEDFCDRYWPCEFVMKAKLKGKGKPVGGRCVNVRSGHGSKGHQLKNGKVFAIGSYESKFSVESFQDEWRWLVYDALSDLLSELRESTSESELEDRVSAHIHRSRVMEHFYEHVVQGPNASLVNHSTCFMCLMRAPEHALPCGHIFCTPCLRAYGTDLDRDTIEVEACPLHYDAEFRSCKIFLKPEQAGVRVLTLDGGGIRGIVELEILKLIEQVWGGGLRVQDFFDLIVGTSTGGIIALGLGARNWSVDECISYFQNLCVQAFTRRSGINIPGMSPIIESIHHSKYETRPFQEALQEAFSKDIYLFGGSGNSNSRTKVAVTATTSGSTSVLANYNRCCSSKLPYNFQRPEKLDSELKIWEAARATSAAPRIFKPFSHEPSKQIYVDGGLYYNNPIQVADLERRLLWPTDGPSYPDFVLSIGTAYNQHSRKKLNEKSSRSSFTLFSHAKGLATLAMDHINSSLDSEKTWTDYYQQLSLPPMYRDRYQRLNPILAEDPPALDNVGCMNSLQIKTRAYMQGDTALNRAAHRLLATSFYFEKTMPIDNLPDGTLQCTGTIRCRLPRHALGELGNFLVNTHERSQGPYFIIRDRDRPQSAEQHPIDKNTISNLVHKCQWRFPTLRLNISSTLAFMEIVLCLWKNEELPISGFPKRLQQENLRSIRHVTDSKIYRWRNRTPSQIKRRKIWTPPLPNSHVHRANTLSSYSNSTYLVGNSSPDHLRDLRLKLGDDIDPLPAELTDSHIFEMGDTSIRAELNEGAAAMTGLPGISITDSDTSSAFLNESPTVYNRFWQELTEEIQLQSQEPSNDSNGNAERDVGSSSSAIRQSSKSSDLDALSTAGCPPSPRERDWDDTGSNCQTPDIRDIDSLYDADEDNGNWI